MRRCRPPLNIYYGKRMSKKLTIFVHHASECLTDHESHGDGLICFSLLNGLAERGHQIYAYADTAPIKTCNPNLHVKTGQHRVPANSLAPWEQAWRADRWLKELTREQPIDLVWRMHPYGVGCPAVPHTGGRPLVVGPLFYNWPEQPGGTPKSGRPRLGVGLQSIVSPIAARGWQRTLSQAALTLCATGPHTALVQEQYPGAEVMELPVIVEPPPSTEGRTARGKADGGGKRVALLFVANLVPNKNPMVFCETIQLLRASGIDAIGTLLGDGPEREPLESYCAQVGMKNAVGFLGKVPNSEVYQRLAEADYLVSASHGEPYGRGIAEAMSVGTPAVCHRSGGPADFIEDGGDGLLVSELTAAAYAERIEQALADPGAWKRLSQNAQRKAEKWRSEVVLDHLEAALLSTVQRAATAKTEKNVSNV